MYHSSFFFLSLIFSPIAFAAGGEGKAAASATQPSQMIGNPLIVLQGEIGFSPNSRGDLQNILTSTPTSCFVLSLFHLDTQCACLAHIDSYTSIESLFTLIQAKFKALGLELEADAFVVKVFGGNKAHDDSKEIWKNLQPLLKRLSSNSAVSVIERTAPELACLRSGSQERLPQLLLSFDHAGELTPVLEKRSAALELLQRCEYGDFNHKVLDIEFAGVPGSQIPYFQAKEARRTLLKLQDQGFL